MVFFGLGEHNFRDIELKFYIFFITSCYLAIKFENTGLKNDNFLVFNLSEFIKHDKQGQIHEFYKKKVILQATISKFCDLLEGGKLETNAKFQHNFF